MSDPKMNAGFDFDECLREELSHMPPPEDMICAITPWRNATRRILVGCALTMITFKILMLQYILPAIGTLMMLTGFRTLRRENTWFARGYVASLICVVLEYPVYFINATIWADVVAVHLIWTIMTTLRSMAYLLQLIALWQGMRQVQKKAGQEPGAKAGLVLVLLYILMWILATIQVTNGLWIWLLVLLYIVAWRKLRALSWELDDVGYVIRLAPLQVPDLAVQVSYFVMIFLCLGIGYAGFSKYPMEWSEQKNIYENKELEEICEELMELGFPQEILEDLTPEDIRQCQGAKQVVVQQHDSQVVSGEYGEIRDDKWIYHGKKAVTRTLRITGVAVELEGETERWKLIQHFYWTSEPSMYGTEAICLWRADKVHMAWGMIKPVSGQILYDREGTSYAAPYYSMGETQYSWETCMNFSFPNKGERYRGYVTYSIQSQGTNGIVDSLINYVHNTELLQYPVEPAGVYWKNHRSFWGSRPYDLVQEGIQFFPPWLGKEEIEQQNEDFE